jgi:hypothetical protein
MTTFINADNGVVSGVAGLKYSADSSGLLAFQTNTTTALTIDTTQGVTFATGLLANNPFAGSYTSGIVIDHTTNLGRITVGSSAAIAFYNGGISARVESMRIDASGNVGIGGTPVTYKLEVFGATSGRSAITSTNSNSAGSAGFHVGSDVSANIGNIVGFGSTHPTKANSMQIGTEQAYPLFIQTSGNRFFPKIIQILAFANGQFGPHFQTVGLHQIQGPQGTIQTRQNPDMILGKVEGLRIEGFDIKAIIDITIKSIDGWFTVLCGKFLAPIAVATHIQSGQWIR